MSEGSTGPGSRLRVTDGTARSRRLGYALAEGYVLPQERTLADRLALTAAVAELVGFSGATDDGQGTWGRLFAQEPAVVMAGLLAVAPEARRADFAARLETDPEAAARELAGFARRVEDWLARAARRDAFSAQIAVIEGRAALTGLVHALAAAADLRPAALAALVLDADGVVPAGDAVEQARAARAALAKAHEQLLNIVAALRPAVQRAFEARLASGQLDPAVGLLVAELRLLGLVEAEANRFVARHRQFYYGDVLGQAPRPAVPESVLLRFTPGAVPVAVPEGTVLVAKAAGAPEGQRYRLAEGLRVAPVRVAEVRSLRFHRNPLISPQSEMGFVTGLGLAALRPAGADGGQPLFAPAGAGEAAMGLDVASPMLLLAEGRRQVEVRLALVRRQSDEAGGDPAAGDPLAAVAMLARTDPSVLAAFGPGPEAVAAIGEEVRRLAAEASPGASTRELVWHGCLRAAASSRQVQAIYGRMVAATLVEGDPWPTGDCRATLLARVAAYLGGPAAAEVAEALMQRPRDEAFQLLLQDGFALSLTTEAGPLAIEKLQVAPHPTAPGIVFGLSLDESAPAIVPPVGAEAPVVEIRMAPQARFCGFSLFEPFALEAVEIAVRVEGLARLAGFSDDGPLNTAQPFMPFGARPKDGASFLIGAPELAAKPVTQVAATIVWADLPRAAGGFEEHYRAYGKAMPPPEPRLVPSYLTPEGWKPLAEAPATMVRRSAPNGPLLPQLRIEGRVPGRPVAARSGTGTPDFRQRHAIRAGLLGLALDCPGEAFGHAAYPGALARAMRPAYVPSARRAIPPAPWTPQIAAITLDYAAESRIALGAPQAAQPGERISQIGLFGTEEIFPARGRPGAGLFPPRLADGALFLRIEGVEATGPVSLVFEMEAASHQRTAVRPSPVAWHYLTAAGWQPLPSWSLASDSTDGLMRSGIVAIDVPDADVLLSGGEMPGEGVWLAAACDENLQAFPGLVSLSANGARAERMNPEAGVASDGARRVWTFDPPRPGVGPIAQVGPSLGGAPPESPAEFTARVSERLRHRGRAVTAWDIERLVLDAFPRVWKAKCFPALDIATGQPAAGAVTIVVVPEAPGDARDRPGQAAMFDVLMLRRIEALLAERASAFARIGVRNPSYERLQLRGKVGFTTTDDSGTLLRRLKLDVSRFLGVWTAEAPMDGFGWSLNLNDIAAMVAGLDYVRFLADFSVLHLVADDAGTYRLLDTARPGRGNDSRGQTLAFHEPWSLALPMADHWIAISHAPGSQPAGATGIGGLGIGETLVVDRMEPA